MLFEPPSVPCQVFALVANLHCALSNSRSTLQNSKQKCHQTPTIAGSYSFSSSVYWLLAAALPELYGHQIASKVKCCILSCFCVTLRKKRKDLFIYLIKLYYKFHKIAAANETSQLVEINTNILPLDLTLHF